MSTVAIGDIHGNLGALDDLLTRIDPLLRPADTVIFLGDYIDRGPDTRGCIDRILEWRVNVPARVVTLMGNHEDWLLRSLSDPTRHSWLVGMEALETVASYSSEAARELRAAVEEAGPRLFFERIELPYRVFLETVPPDHLRFFSSLELYHRTEDALCVHGGLDPEVPSISNQPREALLWGTDSFIRDYRGEERVVYGHWGNAVIGDDAWPRPCVRGRTIGIDTISRGVLTGVMLPGLEVIQSARYECTV